MNPVAIIRGALDAIQAEDEQHREIMLNAVRAELDAIQGGCPCERLARKESRATNVVATVFHSVDCDVAQVKKMQDRETLCGQGKSVAEAIRDMHE